MSTKTLYEEDFYAWLMENVQLLRQRRLAEIDVNNIAEELESMGRSERRELINRLALLFAHLLKWQYQPQKRSPSWKYTIREQRRAVLELLNDSPSLRYELEEKLAEAYKKAILTAAKETRLSETRFPPDCPFSLEQALDESFWPQ